MNARPKRSTPRIAPVLLLALAGTLGACGLFRRDDHTSGIDVVTPEQFKSERPVAVEHKPDAPTRPKSTKPVVPDSFDDVVVIVGDRDSGAQTPAALTHAAGQAGGSVLVDAMVGQINGRPVFASDILGTLDAELGAESRKIKSEVDLGKWIARAAKGIDGRLFTRLRDELALAESRARLTEQQRAGLFAVMTQINQLLVARNEGSVEKAREFVAQAGSGDLDAAVAGERDRYLINKLTEEAIEPNVRVPWRKIERFYQDNNAEFNPLPKAVLRVIMVNRANKVALLNAEEAIAGGAETFKAFVNSKENFWPHAKSDSTIIPLDKPLADLKLFARKEWNEKAAALQPDEVVGPIDNGDFVIWIRRDADLGGTSLSLEEAQLQIHSFLTKQKRDAETNEFFSRLFGKSSFTPLDRMKIQLLAIAVDRHLSPEIAAVVKPELDARLNSDAADAKPLERSPAPDSSPMK